MNNPNPPRAHRSSLLTFAFCLLTFAFLFPRLAPAAEILPLTLQQAVHLALQQNPDVLLARLDEAKARHAVREARAPFFPQLAAGSGLAYSSGFPLSIEGAAPSIFQAQGSQFLFNRSQSFRAKETSEMAAASAHSTAAKAEEVAFRVASTYLDFERATRAVAAARAQIELAQRLERLVDERVQAGREIPLELTRARLNTARARAALRQLEAQAELLEQTVRADLALGDDVRVASVETQLAAQLALPENQDAAVAAALAASREIQRLESIRRAKQFQVRAEEGARWPRVDLVAQYALLGRFNNYEDFFRSFRRHNGQLGLSVQVPLFAGRQIAARVSQAESEVSQTSLRLAAARAGVALESRRLFRQVEQADSAREIARLDLDLARESLSVLLARFDEGRVSLREIEQARLIESQNWEAYFDAQTAASKARLSLLRQTGTLEASLR